MRDAGKVRYLPRRRILFPCRAANGGTDAASRKQQASCDTCTAACILHTCGVHIETHVKPSQDCSTL